MLEINQIEYKSDLYKEAMRFRENILRIPLGLKFTDEDVEQEKDELHYIVQNDNGNIIATIVLKPHTKELAEMRQVAISEELRGKGFGKKLVDSLEQKARGLNYLSMMVKAREYVVPFYKSCGYSINGDEFERVGISHFPMIKAL